MKPTIDTYHDHEATPTRAPRERTREEFARDNKPTEESRAAGLAFVKPMHPNTYRPFNEDDYK
jgi:hypothetical protein